MTDTWHAPITPEDLLRQAREEYQEALKNVKAGDHRTCSTCAYWTGFTHALEQVLSQRRFP